MKERPILFSADMVNAILQSRKTQTRRIVKPQPMLLNDGSIIAPPMLCKYGRAGDRLWVRETWRVGAWNEDDETIAIDYKADNFARREWLDVPLDERDMFSRLLIQSTNDARAAGLKIEADRKYHWEPGESPCRWRPSIHMPRWASRILLEITDIHVERLQGISSADAIAEGIERHPTGLWLPCAEKGKAHIEPCRAYRDLWQSINGAGSWNENPWVWGIEFKRVPL